MLDLTFIFRKQSGSSLAHLLEDDDGESTQAGIHDLQGVNFENLDKAAVEANMEDWL
jgi:hypothetical protein